MATAARTVGALFLLVAGCVRLGYREGQQAPPDALPADLLPPTDSPRDASTGDARPRDFGPRDGRRDVGPPAILVTGLLAEWSTPNTIRWRWTASGQAVRFKAFTLVTGRSPADVLAQTGTATIWTAKENPELGHFTLPGSGAKDPVLATITDQHLPATAYHAQLLATDTDGRVSSTAVAAVSTLPPPSGELVVFSESDTKGYSLPESFALASSKPYTGTYHYGYLASCPAGQTACWENLRRQGINQPLGAVSAQAFTTSAYYEFAAACTGGHAYWADVWLVFGGGSTLWHFSGWTLRCNGAYRLHQIPLRSFSSSGTLLPQAELAKGLFEFCTVGGNWSSGAQVWVDEIRIRW